MALNLKCINKIGVQLAIERYVICPTFVRTNGAQAGESVPICSVFGFGVKSL